MTVLVTGAGGFIGPAVVRAFRNRGDHVRALAAAPGEPYQALPDDVEVRTSEITDFTAVSELCRDVACVVHLAGPSSVSASFADPISFAKTHVLGTLTTLEAARRAGVGRFVYVSSAETYGRPTRCPTDETHEPAPRSPYGVAKLAAEQYVRLYRNTHGLESITLRPFSVYGPGLSPKSLIGTILAQAASGKVELEDLRPVRDYCYVDDLAEAIVAASIPTAGNGHHVFNIASGTGTSVLNLAQIILDLLEVKLPVETKARTSRPNDADINELVADTSRARKELNWMIRTSLAQGLAKTMQAMSR